MEASEIHGEFQGEVSQEGQESKSKKESGASAYQALHDVTLSHVIAKTGEGEDAEVVSESVTYPAGSAVMADALTPRDQERAAAGELSHVLRPLSGDEAKAAANAPALGGEPEFGVFVAEHEAEAHALEQYGHVVVPKEQEMEALSSGADYSAEYQRQAEAAGVTARPNQEATSPANRQRVPDELLVGGETRAGLPYNPGPVESAESSEENSEGNGEEATRPAPPKEGMAEPQTIGESGS